MIAQQDALTGRAELTFAPRDGRTRLIRSVTRPPLVVQRALYVDDGVPDLALVILANPTAGLFAGDLMEISIDLGPGARVHVTTPSATKVHAMPEGAARQTTQLTIGDQSYLEYLPEPVIPQRNARFKQQTSIHVAPGGTLVYGDILAGGRLAMGESLAYAEIDNRLTVSTAHGRVLYHEAFAIKPAERSVRHGGIFGSRGDVTLGTFFVVTPSVSAESLRDAIAATIAGVPGARAGVDVLPGGGGIAVRSLARETGSVRAIQLVAWAEARRLILGVGLPSRRTY